MGPCIAAIAGSITMGTLRLGLLEVILLRKRTVHNLRLQDVQSILLAPKL